MQNDFIKENSDALKFLLEKKFYNRFRKDNEFNSRDGNFVELYITSDCNLKCEYCYLAKHGDKLYPANIRNPKEIIKNLKILLKYFEKENITPKSIDLFSGEIWGTPFGNEIFDILYEYKINGANVNFICIPSNCSFIRDDIKLNHVEYYIKKFENVGVRICFSASVDGLIVEEEARPYKNSQEKERTEENFYNKLFDFCSKYNYGFHPMISACVIEKWKENFLWWINKLHEHNFSMEHIMFLEVRNDEWTDEKIKHYLDFLNFMISYFKEYIYNNNLSIMAADLLSIPGKRVIKDYNTLRITNDSTQPSCTVSRSMCIRLGDLSIAPCHRTSYDKFLYGKFILNEEKTEIIDIEANNFPLALKILTTNMMTSYPKCDSCSIKDFCVKGCFGAQYEASGEIFYPCESVCKLFKAKYLFLYKKYIKEYDLLEVAKKSFYNDKKALDYLSYLDSIIEKKEN